MSAIVAKSGGGVVGRVDGEVECGVFDAVMADRLPQQQQRNASSSKVRACLRLCVTLEARLPQLNFRTSVHRSVRTLDDLRGRVEDT